MIACCRAPLFPERAVDVGSGRRDELEGAGGDRFAARGGVGGENLVAFGQEQVGALHVEFFVEDDDEFVDSDLPEEEEADDPDDSDD